MVLLCKASGTSSITENIFQGRFLHAMELQRLGAKIDIKNRTAKIEGNKNFIAAEVMSSDLRASAALVLAGIVSKGNTRKIGSGPDLPKVSTGAGWFNWGPIDVPDDQMQDVRTVNWAKSELRKNHDKPFFLACGFYRPHLPWYVPRKYFDQFPLDQIVLPETKLDDLDDLPEYGKRFARERACL